MFASKVNWETMSTEPKASRIERFRGLCAGNGDDDQSGKGRTAGDERSMSFHRRVVAHLRAAEVPFVELFVLGRFGNRHTFRQTMRRVAPHGK